MAKLKYSRPDKLKKAIKQIEKGDPLAGGTGITTRLGEFSAVVDLQDLGLDTIEMLEDRIKMGAAVKIQQILENVIEPSGALTKACRLESGLNMRWMSSIGGTILEADGRSPLVTALLVMDTTVELEPEGKNLPLEKILKKRKRVTKKQLITEITIRVPERMAFEYVARSPADRPLVCAAAAVHTIGSNQVVYIALGGYGSEPVRVPEAEKIVFVDGEIAHAGLAASKLYEGAGDAFASAEYRSSVAQVLTERVLEEVMV